MAEGDIKFDEGMYKAKYVAGKTLKGAAVGTAVGAGVLAAMAGAAAFFTPIGWVATAGTYVAGLAGIGSGVLGTAGTIAAGGAIAGGVAGAGIGLATGVAGSDDAATAELDRLENARDRRDVREQKREALAMQQAQMHAAAEAQAASLHVAPPQALPVKPMDGHLLG